LVIAWQREILAEVMSHRLTAAVPRAAFLTLADPTGFFIYDELAVPPLAALGWTVETLPWTAEGVAWGEFDAVVIRSTWDYQRDPQAFLRKLEAIEQAGTRVLNPIATCRWNLEKTYLRDLDARGVMIIPSRWPDHLDPDVLLESFDHFRTERLVAKPLIGANADEIFVLSRYQPDTWPLTTFAGRPLIVQPFIESVLGEGEYSLFYFGSEYSHAVVKTPKSGDFRVQEEHGGSIRAIHPEHDLLAAGTRTLDAIDERLLYARVDLVRLPDGTPAVIEVELIEPSLYFPYDPDSPARFAHALDRMTGRRA
jgi:glutathione synthase/RimK-type ligase-like ATP-grasp enzyme